jgi:hypothetical protein
MPHNFAMTGMNMKNGHLKCIFLPEKMKLWLAKRLFLWKFFLYRARDYAPERGK